MTRTKRSWDTVREPWPVDPLTRTMYVRSVAAGLDAQEADLLRRTALGEGKQVAPARPSALAACLLSLPCSDNSGAVTSHASNARRAWVAAATM